MLGRFCLLMALLAFQCAPALASEIRVPGQPSIETVDFERQVMALFSKAGCNNGSCHGSFQGKNGFRLSLFGYDPARDFNTLTREVLARRVNTVDPDQSLLLQKATGRTPHEGGVRIVPGSWQHDVMRSWIAAGAQWHKDSGTVAELTLNAPEYFLVEAGSAKQLEVKSRYADQSEHVVTAFCDFRIGDDTVAEVSPLGEVRALKPGDTALTVNYRGTVKAVRVLVPATLPAGTAFPQATDVNFIDREVAAKLRLLNMIPSDRTTDAEFLRRITIDTIGSLPTPDEVRAFLADPAVDKRTRKIEQLLTHPLHAAVWATRLSDITGNNTDSLENPPQLKPKRSQQWHDWLRNRVADNVPYDEIVRDILTATSRDGLSVDDWLQQAVKQDEAIDKGFDDSYKDRKTLDLFWRRQANVPIDQWGEKVAAAFLGVRLECAQCHKHPTDRWTQADYRAFANLFGQVTTGLSPDTKTAAEAINTERRGKTDQKNANRLNLVREMYLESPPEPRANARGARPRVRALNHPDTNRPLAPKALGGPEIPMQPGKDAREALWHWMRSPENSYFARSFVNRVWAHYFGIGLVEPVDDFSVANPPTNARLLNALAQDFIAHNFDIRHLERTILSSRTYQLSSRPNATNTFDKNNFARSYVRPIMAESVVDILNAATGTSEKFGVEAPDGAKMIEVGSSRVQNPNLAYVLRIFGRPPRSTACDCERAAEPALPQTLFRMTDPSMLAKLTGGRAAQLAKSELTDEEALEELFLAGLGRVPTDAERTAFVEYRSREKNRQAALVDTLWAIVNTREFILNH